MHGKSIVSILTFDPGTANMGYAFLEGNMTTSEVKLTSYYGVLKTSKWVNGLAGSEEIPFRERIDQLGSEFKLLIVTLKPDYITMEDFVEQGKRVGKTYKEMSTLIEHLRLVSRECGIEADIYSNGYWKKKTLNASRASKVQVKHFISKKVKGVEKIKYQPDHVWDSVGIGYCKWLAILELNGGNLDEHTYSQCKYDRIEVQRTIGPTAKPIRPSTRLIKRKRGPKTAS